jgi:tRNA-2-methylthio-N6-dimethylallyladenosine synthase
MPTATLFTDIIVGFTGETDEQFNATEEAMREFQFDMAYIAMYSPRPGAASFRWEDNVAHEDKRKRYHGLSEILKETGLKANQKRLGKRCTVLVDGVSKKTGILIGKTEGKIPIRIDSEDTDLVGQFVEVEVTSVTPLSIAGQLIETSVNGSSHPAISLEGAWRRMNGLEGLSYQ